MDVLMIYFNAILRDAQRPRRRAERSNNVGELAAFARRLRRAPRLFYSNVTKRWTVRKGAA